MLPKTRRLTAREVKRALAKGRSVRAGGVGGKFLPTPRPKAAVIVPKSLLKSAVKRNALRRAVYRRLPELPAGHLVLLMRAIPQSEEALGRELSSLLEKI